MTIHDAKLILMAWRPDCPERENALVIEALALASSHPALKEWFSAHRAWQERTTRVMREMPVPSALREAVLQRARNVEAFPVRVWWRQALTWSAAAAVVVVIGLTVFRSGDGAGSSVAVFRSRMVGAVLRQYTMDIVTDDMAAVRSFLATRQAPADYELPEKLRGLPVSGAGVLSWQGGRVSMVCLESQRKGTLFLFVVDAAAVMGGARAGRDFADVNRLATVTWTNGSRTYVLAGQGDQAELERYF